MEEYKQYLNDDADEAERRAAAQVMEGLAGLRLEAKVQAVAAERAALRRRIVGRRIFISLVALALLAGATYVIMRKVETPAPPPSEQQQEPNAPLPPEKTEEKKAVNPIAQLRPEERLPNPRYPAPETTMIRGDEDENKVRKAMLDQVWYTDYPLTGLKTSQAFVKADENLKKRDFTAAYLELERLEGQMANNDTLRYLKGYCLLEMGEGAEALANFDQIQGRYKAWESQLQWYRGLAMLLADDREKALALFKQLAARVKHPYRRQAEKAVGLLSQ
jgi:tetratricopeptide (TPR) repeat protein